MITHPLVADSEHTCGACPDQTEGELVDGRHFYLRYRGGYVTLAAGADRADVIGKTRGDGVAAMEYGDPLQGMFESDDERNDIFATLLAELDGES